MTSRQATTTAAMAATTAATMPATMPATMTTAGMAAGTRADGRASGRVAVVAQALMAMALGVFIVGMVGFSHIEALHNAAHDTRHSNAFPCH